MLPSLDAHAHLDPARTAAELADSGAVLAMTLSLDEAALVLGRCELPIAWGVGCHPRRLKSQESFDAERFGEMAEQTGIVGEVGLDTGSVSLLKCNSEPSGKRWPLSPNSHDWSVSTAIVQPGWLSRSCANGRLPSPFFTGGRGLYRKRGKRLRLGVTSPSIQPSLDSRGFVARSRRSVCSSKAILATVIHRPRFRAGSGGWSTWSPSSSGFP